MGDAVSWTALGITIPVVFGTIGMGVAWGRLSATVNNGLTATVKRIEKKLDSLPCVQPHCPVDEDNEQ